jgi:hypothetical protein
VLVRRFGKFEGITTEQAQRELVSIGAPAVDALVAALGQRKDGWTAAKVLGEIGVSRPDVIAALRSYAGRSFWHAMALGMLGDHEWLAAQPPAVAVPGLTARLRAITQGGPPRPIDYRPLEAYLAGRGAGARAQVEKTLEPGSSYVQPRKEDVDEALRGLGSEHAVVRWHAAALLGDRGLGAAAGKRIVPALAALLADPHRLVRRLAVLSLADWREAARPYQRQMAALRGDPDETVARVARHVIEDKVRW